VHGAEIRPAATLCLDSGTGPHDVMNCSEESVVIENPVKGGGTEYRIEAGSFEGENREIAADHRAVVVRA
jgi:hypothetical protein